MIVLFESVKVQLEVFFKRVPCLLRGCAVCCDNFAHAERHTRRISVARQHNSEESLQREPFFFIPERHTRAQLGFNPLIRLDPGRHSRLAQLHTSGGEREVIGHKCDQI